PMATPEPPPDLSAINPDYIGWIRIDGTGINYPVVQGADNKKYLDTTFAGEKNAAGTIFMDTKCADGFAAPLAILYGHNMKDGSMFAALNRYLDAEYRREHPAIEIATAEGETLRYRILTAQVTDIYDEAYSLPEAGADALADYAQSIGAEKDTPLLILSTCTDAGGKDKRLLVHAVLEK
ncbi:class B sortase, partial [Eubacteriales bacterium OttesenSCG-928-M02]|nr:class B sortase [Eubacteriales bacterium OttesenSCG-928-M02]